jgi:hypothetical protein
MRGTKIAKADTLTTTILAAVVEASWNGDELYALMDFQNLEDATPTSGLCSGLKPTRDNCTLT